MQAMKMVGNSVMLCAGEPSATSGTAPAGGCVMRSASIPAITTPTASAAT